MMQVYDRRAGVLRLLAPGAPVAEVSLTLPDAEIEAAVADYVARYAPPEPVPNEVTMFQARAVLLASGLFDAVDEALRALGAKSVEFQAWEYANHFTRHGPLVNAMAHSLGLTDAQVDDMFRAAARIEA
jgi:hypothetical protein